MTEVWKNIDGYKGIYEVSNLGNVRNKKRNKLLKIQNVANGYAGISLSINGKRKNHLVHRLVAGAFIENVKNKPEVNHKNLDKKDNALENLEWVYKFENINHSIRNKPIVSSVSAVNNVKTFPLQFTEEKLNEIRIKAEKQNKSIKQYILDLIEKDLKDTK